MVTSTMRINTRFTVAVHVLALLALENRPLSSKYIAGSVNTNPVVIRRILGALRQAGLVVTRLGVEGGSRLTRPAAQITLLEVYRVVEPGELFALHNSDPNPLCPCGRMIQPVLTPVFNQAEAALEAVLAGTTIADVRRDIKEKNNEQQNSCRRGHGECGPPAGGTVGGQGSERQGGDAPAGRVSGPG